MLGSLPVHGAMCQPHQVESCCPRDQKLPPTFVIGVSVSILSDTHIASFCQRICAGKLPITIKALPEGSLLSIRVPLEFL